MNVLFHDRSGREVLAALFLFVCVSPANGQVQVIFANRSLSNACGLVDAPIYGLQPECVGARFVGNGTNNGGDIVYLGPLLAGSGFTAALFAGPEGTSGPMLQEVAHTTFRTGSAAGYIPNITLTLPGLT